MQWQRQTTRIQAANRQARQQAAMHNFVTAGTLSGEAVVAVTSHIFLDFVGESEQEGGHGKGRMRRRRKPSAQARAKQLRRAKFNRVMAEMELRERAADEGDCRDAYPVAGFSAVRWRRGRLEALVQWEGEQWIGHDSWEPIGNLTPDMRCAVQDMADETYTRRQQAIGRAARRNMIKRALIGRRLRHTHGLMVGTFKEEDASAAEECRGEGQSVRRTRRIRDEEDGGAVKRRPPRRRKRRIAVSDSDGDSADDSVSR